MPFGHTLRQTVTANGPLSLVVAAGVVNKLVEGAFGITLANSFNSGAFPPNNPASTNVLAADNVVGPTIFATGNNTNGGTQTNRFRFNSAGNNTNSGTVGGTQTNRVRFNSTGSNAASNRAAIASPGGSVHKSVHKSVADRITKLAKKFSGPASRSTKKDKSGADGTSSSDE